MSLDGNDVLQNYLTKSGRTTEEPSQPVSTPVSTPVSNTIGQVTPSSPVPNSKIRSNPRTGSPLHRKVIPGTGIEIDYDPATGGVFLDSGELEALSKVPDIKAKLEMLLTP